MAVDIAIHQMSHIYVTHPAVHIYSPHAEKMYEFFSEKERTYTLHWQPSRKRWAKAHTEF